MSRKPIVNSQMLYKFVVYQIKGIVSDADGEAILIGAFDKVFYDLYGLENFSMRLSKMCSNRGMKTLIDKVGLEQLIALMKNPTYYNVLRDLTLISRDLARLRKQIRKDRKNENAKKEKYETKEFNDIMKLYRRGIKALRKELRIKDVHKAYKHKYKALREFADAGQRTDLYWDEIDFKGLSSQLDDCDDPYDGDDYFGDDYDPNDSTILEDFIRELNGGGRREHLQNRKQGRRRQSFEYVDDEDDDDYDDSEEIDELAEKVNSLCGHMQTLTDTVQGLASQNSPKPQRNHKLRQQPVRQPNYQNGQLNTDIADIKTCVFNMMNQMRSMDDRLQDIEDYVDEEDDGSSIGSAYDADLDPYADAYVNPQVQEMIARQQAEMRPKMNQTQPNSPGRSNRASVASAMIDQINDQINQAPALSQAMLDNAD